MPVSSLHSWLSSNARARVGSYLCVFRQMCVSNTIKQGCAALFCTEPASRLAAGSASARRQIRAGGPSLRCSRPTWRCGRHQGAGARRDGNVTDERGARQNCCGTMVTSFFTVGRTSRRASRIYSRWQSLSRRRGRGGDVSAGAGPVVMQQPPLCSICSTPLSSLDARSCYSSTQNRASLHQELVKTRSLHCCRLVKRAM